MHVNGPHLGLIAVGAIALAACGSDDSSSPDRAGTEAPAATEAPTIDNSVVSRDGPYGW